MNRFWYRVKQVCIIFVASLCTSVALEIFMLPGNIIAGGALGIASTLDIILTGMGADKWYLSTGVWLLVVNLPIMVCCYATFSARFSTKTLLYLLFLSAELVVMRVTGLSAIIVDVLNPDGVTSDWVVQTLMGGFLHGLSLPLVLSVNSSTGGSDIVGLLIQRRSQKSSSDGIRIILVVDVIVVLASVISLYFVNRNTNPNALSECFDSFIYSIACMLVCQLVQEYVFKGFSSAVELEITTDKPEQMAEVLGQKLSHGTTIVKVVGGYSHENKTMVLCVINKGQLTYARRLVHEVDETAFAYVENVKEVIGKGFENKETDVDNNN